MINFFEKLNRWNSFHKNVYILLWLIWTMQSIFMRKAAKSTHFVLLGHTLQCSVAFLVNILTFCSEYFNWFIFCMIWRVQLFYLAWSSNKFGFLTLKFGIVFHTLMFDCILQSFAAYFNNRPPVPIFDILVPMMHFFQFNKWGKDRHRERRTQLFKRLLGVNRSVTYAVIREELRRHTLLNQVTRRNLS